jgi:general secretion pathway protein A
MYLTFFGLTEKPFAITPDPRYLYLSARHSEALAHLVYGINDAGGFIQLTGEVGTGKTTTIRTLLARAPKNAEIALIINPRMSPLEFLQTLCEELGLGVPDSAEVNTKELVDLLNRYLLRAHADGRRVVLIVDEAQNLTPEVLEQVRLLTNLETESQKLLQIILIGQPELRELLGRNELRQLAQRVTARYHLDPLGQDEVGIYVKHRLRIAGAHADIFTAGALREVYRLTGGVPRVINVICDRALLGAYTQDQHEVSARLVRQAGNEVFDERLAPRWVVPAAAAAGLLVLAAAVWVVWRIGPGSRPPAPVPAVAAVAPPTSGPVVATAPAVPAIAGPLTAPLASLLRRTDVVTTADAAVGQLLGLWGGTYDGAAGDACAQAQAQGYECVSLRGSLAEVRELNRPAVLLLSDATGKPQSVVLSQLGEETAWLELGKVTANVSIADLSRIWFGDLTLLWKPPATTANSLTQGMRGAAVQQLRARLLKWRGRAGNEPVSNVYDKELAHMVEEFQLAHHVTADGVAGLETQLLLDSVLASPGSPLLRATGNATPIIASDSAQG